MSNRLSWAKRANIVNFKETFFFKIRGISVATESIASTLNFIPLWHSKDVWFFSQKNNMFLVSTNGVVSIQFFDKLFVQSNFIKSWSFFLYENFFFYDQFTFFIYMLFILLKAYSRAVNWKFYFFF